MRLGRRAQRLSPEPWLWAGRRVLVEQPDPERADALVSVLRRAGYSVTVCSGPAAGERCPLAAGEECPAAAGADAVVSGLGFESDETRSVLTALRRRLPHTPVVVDTDAEQAARWPQLVSGCELVVGPVEPGEVLGRLQLALDREVGGLA